MKKTQSPQALSPVSTMRLGSFARLAWNDELVEVIYKSGSRVTIRHVPIRKHDYSVNRDVSITVEARPVKTRNRRKTSKATSKRPTPSKIESLGV